MAMWVLFDLNGTLVDPSVLAGPLKVGDDFIGEALDEANTMAMLTTLSGVRADFKTLLEAALRRRLARAGKSADALTEALERLPEMPAYPDARAALEQLRDGGARLGVLTQSSKKAAEAVLSSASLLDVFAFVASAPDSGAYKPDPRAYLHGIALTRSTPESATGTGSQAGSAPPADVTWFVAGHWWDVAGATAAGLRGAWVARTDVAYPDHLPQPAARGADLLEVAEQIMARTGD